MPEPDAVPTPSADLSTCAVLVLAAGAGKRMGGPKALMTVQGRPWWRTQQKRLEALGLKQVWVVSPRVMEVLALEEHAPSPLEVVESHRPMFASIVAGLNWVTHGSIRSVFVLPIDVPVAGRPVWEALAASGACAAPSHGGDHGHPVCLPISWVESKLLAQAENPDARLDELVRDDLTAVPVNDPDVTWNLNTPEDVARWVKANKGTA